MPSLNPVNSILFPKLPIGELALPQSKPTEQSIDHLAKKVINELDETKLTPQKMSQPNICVRFDRSCCKSTGSVFLPRTISDLDQEIGSLRKVHDAASALDKACSEFQNECSVKLSHLSIFRPSTWKALFLETVDLILIHLLDGILSFGTIRIAAHRVAEDRESIHNRLSQMKGVELRALDELSKAPSLKLLEAYWLIGDLDPEEKDSLEGLGKCLKHEGVYGLAADVLKEYIEKNKQNLAAWQEYVQALKEDGKFIEAEQAIKEIHRSFAGGLNQEAKEKLESAAVECLLGRGLQDQAIKAFAEFKVSNQETTRKMFCSLAKKDISKIDDLKQLFFKLEAPSKLVSTFQTEEATVDFWINLLTAASAANKLKEQGEIIIAKLQKTDLGLILKCLEKAVDDLEAKKAKLEQLRFRRELDAMHIPDSLKAVVRIGAQHESIQLETSISSDIEALRALLDSRKLSGREHDWIKSLDRRLTEFS